MTDEINKMNVICAAANHRYKSMAAKKLIYPAADRNKEKILAVLRQYLRRGAIEIFLEIASGSGQHIGHFAPHFPHITFYPSECDHRLLDNIAAHVNGFSNVTKPLVIDVTTDYRTWGGGIFRPHSVDYIYNANMMHISPYECCVNLFKNAGELLKPDGLLFTYGPYAFNGRITPESNVNFDRSLKSQDPEWGLRDVSDLETLARDCDIQIINVVDMPANNKTIVWKKKRV